MPNFKITQKQGSKTITSELEAPNFQAVLAFLNEVSTAKVTCIQEVVFEADGGIPADDMQYYKEYKAFGTNADKVTKQILVHNVKLTKSTEEIAQAIKTHLEVCKLKVKSVTCRLLMPFLN